MLDLSRVVSEAKSIVAAAIYMKHAHSWFIGLIIHGSALKGVFIPGCSDIDFQLFLDDTAFLVWSLPKHRAIELLPPATRLGQTIRTFYQAVQAYSPIERSIKEALMVI